MAHAKSLLGPWEKYDQNPSLTKNDIWTCPGHGTATERGSHWHMLHHAYQTGSMQHVGRQGVLSELEQTAGGWPRFLNNHSPLPPRILEGHQVNAVVIDDRAGGYQATRHLLAPGYRRIAHLGGPQHLNIYKLRRPGYEDILREAGLPVEEELIIEGDIKMKDGHAALPQSPDTVFSSSNFTVAGALAVLGKRGLRMPQDIGLVSFSNELFSRFTTPMLTTIDQHCELMDHSATRTCSYNSWTSTICTPRPATCCSSPNCACGRRRCAKGRAGCGKPSC